MTQIIFDNVNEPAQPRNGVYKWYFLCNGKEFCLYIGNAGARNSYTQKSTLLRAMSEACRSTFTTDSINGIKYTKLDTDFILGTCIQFIIENGIDCHWKHIDDDPYKEIHHARLNNPLIQDTRGATPKIYKKMNIEKPNRYWDITKSSGLTDKQINQKRQEAILAVYEEFKKILKEKGISCLEM